MQKTSDKELIGSLHHCALVWHAILDAADRGRTPDPELIQKTSDPDHLLRAIKSRAESSKTCAAFLETAGEIIRDKSQSDPSETGADDIVSYVRSVFSDPRVKKLAL